MWIHLHMKCMKEWNFTVAHNLNLDSNAIYISVQLLLHITFYQITTKAHEYSIKMLEVEMKARLLQQE